MKDTLDCFINNYQSTSQLIEMDKFFVQESEDSEREVKLKVITRGIGLAVRMPKHRVVSSGGYSFLRRKLSSSGRGVVRTIPMT